MDQILRPIEEPLLDSVSRFVFCAAVDMNGRLPTHNRKFPSNTARTRSGTLRIANFDDRAGSNSRRNTRQLLPQVYRRDMGGSEFVMMKYLAARNTLRALHWGGWRLAYRFRNTGVPKKTAALRDREAAVRSVSICRAPDRDRLQAGKPIRGQDAHRDR